MVNKEIKRYLVIVITLICLAFILYTLPKAIKANLMPPKLSHKDITVIEKFCHFQFPQSTNIIKIYWDAWDSEKLYICFEFDKKDLATFMNSLSWKKDDFKFYNGNLEWRKVEHTDNFHLPMSVKKRVHSWIGIPKQEEDLEWWIFDNNKIKWVFHVEEAGLNKWDLILDQSIILEDVTDLIRGFVFMDWNSFEKSNEFYFKLYA